MQLFFVNVAYLTGFGIRQCDEKMLYSVSLLTDLVLLYKKIPFSSTSKIEFFLKKVLTYFRIYCIINMQSKNNRSVINRLFEQNFIKKEVMNYDNAAEDPG